MSRPLRFRFLRTRLAVLYSSLFAGALLLVALAVITAVTASARGMVRGEMAASGAVYGQIWSSRSDQLRQAAAVVADNATFQQALSASDETAVRTGLETLRLRQKIDAVLVLDRNGHATAAGFVLPDAALQSLFAGLDSGTLDSGVLNVGDLPYQAVATPVMNPTLAGWVVSLQRLDAVQMRRVEALSAIPLSARVVIRGTGGWHASGAPLATQTSVIDEKLAGRNDRIATVEAAEGQAMLLARAMPSFNADAPAALLLTYPLKRAMKTYEPMLYWLIAISAAGLAILLIGSWTLAGGLTRPITALDQAVNRLKQGEHAEVPVTSSDEIGRLAASFNLLAGDIRDREAKLTHMALHDQETGLPNRLALERRVAGYHRAHVILFSIDRFEVVRNAIGYDSMALLLSTLGQRLSALGDGQPMARVGAGALGLIIEATSNDEAMTFAERLCEAAHAPIKLNGAPVDIALTAGVARTDESDPHIPSPLDRAAIAVDQARAGRRTTARFNGQDYGDPGGNLSLISELMAALRNGEFSLNYQPKYDLRSDRVTAVEALARWTHPRRGVVSPDLFVGMAEETGHIRPLTEWVVHQAITDQAALQAAGHPMTVCINISSRLLADDSFADFALARIEASGARLCFEITETAVMDNPEVALAIIERFSAAGVEVSIDDYGSGLSSLAYLKKIRADELKIDKSFILSLDQSARDGLLVKSTIDLAHGLGLRVTAEGVETPTALALLRGMGCDMVQGYLIGRPMPLQALVERLTGPGTVDVGAVA